MVLTKSQTAAEKATAKAAAATVTGIPTSDDGATAAPRPIDGALVNETEDEELRTNVQRLAGGWKRSARSGYRASRFAWRTRRRYGVR
ncbi:unnamed protein product [Linum trigynum]|uniref:Uncharacterized protein n=1 Tax=Linum trigynum TaxID=586398 RepID=A0AAV2CJM0_9ROSI